MVDLEDLPLFEKRIRRTMMPNIRQCAGKRGWSTHRKAQSAAWSIRASETGEKMHAYKCMVCRRWHIGH